MRARADAVRRRGRDDGRDRPAAGRHAGQRAGDAPGAQITDTVIVTALGVLTATVNVELWGPFQTREAMTVHRHAVLDRHAHGERRRQLHDGAASRSTSAGYYTYRESIAADAGVRRPSRPRAARRPRRRSRTAAPDGDDRGRPTDVVRAGLADLRHDPRHGPRQDAGDDRGRAVRAVRDARGDALRRQAVLARRSVTRAGRRHRPLAGRPRSRRPASTPTASGSPAPPIVAADDDRVRASSPRRRSRRRLIITGRGDVGARRGRARPRPHAPTRVRVADLGDRRAGRRRSASTCKKGALGVPADIHRTGWWRDGAAPGDPTAARC